MAQDRGHFDLPGLRAHWVGHPTDIDQDGCDGLYVEGYYFTNFALYVSYCHFNCKLFFTFSVS